MKSKPIRSAMLLLLAAVSCVSTVAQTSELSERDYAVLSDFLSSQLAKKNGIDDIRVGARGSVVAPITATFLKPLDAEQRDWMMQRLKGISFDTIESFERCAGKPMAVKHNFNLPVEYEVAAPQETKDIKALYGHHPQTIGYIQFSCVGVNSSGAQALFSLERLMTHSAVGKWVLMERGSSGNWVVKGELVRWIA